MSHFYCMVLRSGDVKIFDVVSQFQLKYLKMLLKCKSSTPNVMFLCELGVYPIELAIKSMMLNFWCSVVACNRVRSHVY